MSSASPAGTVVVADDDDDCLQLASMQLKRLGYHVIEARDGKELCEQVADHIASGGRLSAIITDVAMPVCDGVVAAKWIHELAPELPVILVTGNRDRSMWKQAGDAGVRRILPKPFTTDELTSALAACVEGRVSRLSFSSLTQLLSG